MKLPVRFEASYFLDADGKALSANEIVASLNSAQRPEVAAKQAEIDRLMFEHCPDEMTASQAIRKLNALTEDDPEQAHREAEAVLLEFLRGAGNPEVADAFEKADERVGFWYA